MLLYFIIIFIALIFCILSIDRNTDKKTIYGMSILLFFILSLFAGTRLMGFDYENYLIHFKECPNILNYHRVMISMEIGYELFVSLFKTFSSSFHLFLFIFTCLSIWITLKLFYKYSPYPLLSFLMFFAYSYFTQVMGQMRQPIAISITYFFILPLLLNKKYVKAGIISIITAILLHKSIFFLLFGLIISDRLLTKKLIHFFIFFTLGCYISSTILLDTLLQIIPQNFYLYDAAMDYLVYKSHTQSFSMGMIERFLMCLIIWNFTDKYQLYNQRLLRIFVNFYFVGTCIYFATIAISVEFASRGTQVLSYSLFFILPIIYKNINMKDKKILLTIIILWSVYLSVSFMKSLDIFLPYKSIIIQ